MKWKATHILKVNGDAPRRVMLNSGCLFTRAEWDVHQVARYFIAADERCDPQSIGALWENTDENTTRQVDTWTEDGVHTAGWSLKSIDQVKQGESTTSMRKAVSRITTDFKVKVAGKWRRLIVTMGPGDILTMRPEGCRSSSARTFDYGSAWGLAGKQMARKLVRERKEARKAKRAAA